MIYGYARTSRTDQNLDLQIRALEAAGCDDIVTEQLSGATMNRPALQEIIGLMEPGDVLVVWKLDRLARSLKQLLETVEGLEKRGIKFRSITEQMDTSTPGGRLIFHVFGALAEFERSLLRERTMAGLDAARKRGRVSGRPRLLDDDAVKQAAAMLRDPAISLRDVADRFGVHPATIGRYFPGGRAALLNGH